MTEMIIRELNELIFSPRPYFCVIGDLRIGPNCLGSPASTSWPPMWWVGSRRSATGMMHSGSVAWPASSIKMCVKWLRGKQAETNLGKWFWNRKVLKILTHPRRPRGFPSPPPYAPWSARMIFAWLWPFYDHEDQLQAVFRETGENRAYDRSRPL